MSRRAAVGYAGHVVNAVQADHAEHACYSKKAKTITLCYHALLSKATFENSLIIAYEFLLWYLVSEFIFHLWLSSFKHLCDTFLLP